MRTGVVDPLLSPIPVSVSQSRATRRTTAAARKSCQLERNCWQTATRGFACWQGNPGEERRRWLASGGVGFARGTVHAVLKYSGRLMSSAIRRKRRASLWRAKSLRMSAVAAAIVSMGKPGRDGRPAFYAGWSGDIGRSAGCGVFRGDAKVGAPIADAFWGYFRLQRRGHAGRLANSN